LEAASSRAVSISARGIAAFFDGGRLGASAYAERFDL
jgi:hypothetical protein